VAITTRRTFSVLRRAAAAEGETWRGVFSWVRRSPLPLAPGDEAFGYVGVVKPFLAVFIVLSIVELPILDLIVRHVVHWASARWIVDVLSVWGLCWMVGFGQNLRRRPHVVGAAGIRARTGAGVDITVPWADIDTVGSRFRSLPSGGSVQVDGGVLHLSVAKQTSVDVRLREPTVFALPTGPSEPVGELRLYADDPDGFLRAARARLSQG
jgi:hypothetical protein